MSTNALIRMAARPSRHINGPDLDRLFSGRARAIQSSAIREILKITERPEVISFAGGLPAPATFPVGPMCAAFVRVLSECGREALQYTHALPRAVRSHASGA